MTLAQVSISHADWLERFDRLTERDRGAIRERIARFRDRPRFLLLVVASADEVALAATLASIEAQLYPAHAVHAVRAGNVPAFGADVDWIAVTQAGDRLADHALYWMAEVIGERPEAAMVYADEDTVDAQGNRTGPRFKPDWSPEHLRAVNYVGRFAAFRAPELRAAGGITAASLEGDGHELNLRVAGSLRPAQVAHVPALLYHRSSANPPSLPAPRVRYPLPVPPPLVSIIVPTRDAAGLLKTCIESVLGRSSYPRVEILVVDNQSSQPDALAYLQSLAARPGVRVLKYDRPFNFSALNNFAVREAKGEVVLLLNNDTEVITPGWIEEMLGHLACEGVGAVGAKLYFSDGRVQHAGDAVGPGGCADHMHEGIARDDPGYCSRAVVAQEVSAVTGACLMTWKRLYLDLGGLDERWLPVAFNDVDYCLRLQERRGLRVIFTPHAELYHHESATRGKDRSWRQLWRAFREVRAMRWRWGARMKHDPYYNPNFSYDRPPDFSLGHAPRAGKPWIR